MLPEKELEDLKKELDDCQNPLFIYDDDPDGLCSFLLLYRYKGEGNGIFVKSLPKVGEVFVERAKRYEPDKIFILDMPDVDEAFFDNIKVPVVWVDHHKHRFEPPHIKSFNPHNHDMPEEFASTTAICYAVVKQDIWLAAVGAIGDWTLPPFLEEFRQEYPDLLQDKIKNPPEALFDSPLSPVINIFSMLLKGDTKTVKRCIKNLTKIKNPYDLLEGKSDEVTYILKKVDPIIEEYDELIKRGMEQKAEDGIIAFLYEPGKYSFSKEVSNFLQYKNPERIVIVGRQSNGEYKLSLRSQKKSIPPVLEKALVGIQGYGGGHEHACGACVNADQIDEFLERLREGFTTQQ